MVLIVFVPGAIHLCHPNPGIYLRWLRFGSAVLDPSFRLTDNDGIPECAPGARHYWSRNSFLSYRSYQVPAVMRTGGQHRAIVGTRTPTVSSRLYYRLIMLHLKAVKIFSTASAGYEATFLSRVCIMALRNPYLRPG